MKKARISAIPILGVVLLSCCTRSTQELSSGADKFRVNKSSLLINKSEDGSFLFSMPLDGTGKLKDLIVSVSDKSLICLNRNARGSVYAKTMCENKFSSFKNVKLKKVSYAEAGDTMWSYNDVRGVPLASCSEMSNKKGICMIHIRYSDSIVSFEVNDDDMGKIADITEIVKQKLDGMRVL